MPDQAFMLAATPHKKLRIHLGSHVHPFYTEDGRRDQIRFFDFWLKGIDNGVMDEPVFQPLSANVFNWKLGRNGMNDIERGSQKKTWISS